MEDPILFWNGVALECNRLDHTNPVHAQRNQRGPTLTSRALAMAHIAMHDAYVLARAGMGVPVPAPANDAYLPLALRPAFSGAPGAVPAAQARYAAAAVAAATSVTLLHLYPGHATEINQQFREFCAMWGTNAAAHRFGSAVGQAVINLRKDDGANPDPDSAIADYMDSAAPGRHREDPLNGGQGFLGPRYGLVRPFAISKFHLLAPNPPLGSAAYLADLNEVAAKGAAADTNGHTRSVDETVVGLYWAYDGPQRIGTPPRQYNQVLRTIAVDKGLSTEQMARLFLLANLAMGDAGIQAWFYKYHYDLWRPVVGIREHDSSMGPGALAGSNPVAPPCNPFWRPLGAPRTNTRETAQTGPVPSFTPPFPAYPSGHATFGAAAFHVARLYLRSIGKATIAADGSDNVAFQFVSEELDGSSFDPDGNVRPRHMRRFVGLHQAIYENAVSRVFLGVHWRFDGTTGHSPVQMLANAASDNIGGVPLGLAIANDLFSQASATAGLAPSGPDAAAPAFDATP